MRSEWFSILAALSVAVSPASAALPANQVKTAGGILEGTLDAATGVRVFKGIPYAAPPVGELRWKAPQPAPAWQGVRKADAFGPRAMQRPVFADMVFRSNGMSEDCLYLNVWTPAKGARERLPVLVYFYGGGFIAGDGSEPRYDGESMAHKGIVAVTVNYRLGIFGFFAHPELTKESPHHASGNYGMLDQAAALQWVRRNIAAFGGDPKRITIGGESAGSFSVSMLMASPLSRGLIAGAIGESGAEMESMRSLARAEETGTRFAKAAEAPTLAELRELPAEKLMEAASAGRFRFSSIQDGYFLPQSPREIFTAGKQARVPLLAGWNAEESGPAAVLQKEPETPEGFERAVRALYPDAADEALKLFHATDAQQVKAAAAALAGARFIGYGTWKWTELQAKTGRKPVYRYLFARPRPGQTGAYHSVEIEYALGNLDGNKVYAWTDDDRKVSAAMQEYFANFIKKGDPNGPGLPEWPASHGGDAVQVMRLDLQPRAEPETGRELYLFLDKLSEGGR